MQGAFSQRLTVWALALLSTVGYGALYYAQPLLAVAFEHTSGWNRTRTSLAFTLALLTTAFLAPTVGGSWTGVMGDAGSSAGPCWEAGRSCCWHRRPLTPCSYWAGCSRASP